ncbi:MAG: pitrilysin family protein [Nitrospirae bacterium]|nr:pitrilysin family protein [Nitrospirota bacterium]MDA1302759.1 pitrilysin family protein [Nitrospirota bacterium]
MRKVVLDNGVRVVMERMSTLRSVAIGLWINVGTRDEAKGQEGLSHFLEHMMFKGTRRRSASQISNEIDSLGGEMNAFTTHESTAFYVKVLDQQIDQAVDLLADLFHHSRFTPTEIEREKQVVLEEIRTVRDDPEDFVQELHANHVMRGHPLGQSILGTATTMKRVGRGDILKFVGEQYHPEKLVISIAGNFNEKTLVPLLNRSFGKWKPSPSKAKILQPRQPPVLRTGTFVHPKKLEQTHICFGLPGIPANHPTRYASHTLNALFGGGVSSRLFQQVREKRGLAYTIYSQLSSFSDSGTLTIYAATGAKEAPELVDVVRQEVRKLRNRAPAGLELTRTKNQLKGTLMLGLEGTYGRMNKLAKDEICQGRYVSLKEMLSEIDKISKDQLQAVAQDLLRVEEMTVTALGQVAKTIFSG